MSEVEHTAVPKEPTVLTSLELFQFQTTSSMASPFPNRPRLPFWIQGYDGNNAFVEAYAENLDEIRAYWPVSFEATSQPAAEFVFDQEHPQMPWFNPADFVIQK